MPQPNKYIVGREQEIKLFSTFINSKSEQFILNIYGPGGIGKSEICVKILDYSKKHNYLIAFIQIDSLNLTFDKVLYNIKECLEEKIEGTGLKNYFSKFNKRLSEYLIVKEIIDRGGGYSALFDALGSLVPDVLTKALTSVGKTVSDDLTRRFRDRYAIQQYMNGAENWLTESFIIGVKSIQSDTNDKIVILFDTYEKIATLDEWVCTTLIKSLPEKIKVVITGRDRIQEMGFHWKEFTNQIIPYEVVELDEDATKLFYNHHGLSDPVLLRSTIDFTGGYPLCMTLAIDLSKKIGWDQVAGFKFKARRYEVARQLLDRLLEQEEVLEVKDFLEKGVVTLWFDVQAIAYLLDTSIENAENIYHKISRFSFIQPMEYGLKFHDKVREILLERLEYMDKDVAENLLSRWRDYYLSRIDQQWIN